jgi:hypothetical protein
VLEILDGGKVNQADDAASLAHGDQASADCYCFVNSDKIISIWLRVADFHRQSRLQLTCRQRPLGMNYPIKYPLRQTDAVRILVVYPD